MQLKKVKASTGDYIIFQDFYKNNEIDFDKFIDLIIKKVYDGIIGSRKNIASHNIMNKFMTALYINFFFSIFK